MTEQEWLTCQDPAAMFEHLGMEFEWWTAAKESLIVVKEPRIAEDKIRAWIEACETLGFCTLERGQSFRHMISCVHNMPNREHLPEAADFIRCIIGNPFHPARFDPAWSLTFGCRARQLAEQIYEERGWEILPILCDMLEESGCWDQQLLAHGRSGGPHCRGCHLLDLVLGKV